MAQTTNTFRIFVSSTFSDLHEERNALQKHVFPRLREMCLQNNCRFQAIDLRWGVSAEAGRDQKTMQICLEEIKRCQRVTPRPNFIVLLGDRYGWCPLPEEIPAAEFEKIIKNVSDEEKAILVWEENQPPNQKGWYRLDENAVPPVYCLQPRGNKYAEYSDWEKVERKLRTILECAVENLRFENEESRAKYVASATEQEIIQGLQDKNAAGHIFCFFRSFSNRNELPADFTRCGKAKDFFELDENKNPNEIANQKLENLKNRLRDELPKQNVHKYRARWLNEDSESKVPLTTDHIGDLPKEFQNLPGDLAECEKLLNAESTPQGENLCLDVFRQLARVILAEISEIENLSAVQKEKAEHKKFGDERAKNFVGRADYLEKVNDYIKSDNQKPLVFWGASGSGKSALMARVAEEISKKNPVVRFIGATPQSSDIRALLESLCRQISAEYSADDTTIPADYNELVKEFPKRLESAAKEKTLIVLLDALDQLSEADNAHNLRWLPDDLPANVRLIVSTLPDDSLKILERRLPAENIIQLESMTKDEGGKVLDLWLSDAKRTLQDNQRAEVLDKFTAAEGLPLYLKFVFEEARLWHSYDKLKPLATDVPSIIGELFERLSEDSNHGKVMVERSLGYLAASRYGLTEDELIGVLSEDEKVMDDFRERSKESPKVDSLPIVVWSRLYFDLEPYLTERASADAALLSFYHRQLGEVTAQKYLAEKDKQHAHQHLANYFATQKLSHRKVFELPWQLVGAELWLELSDVLRDLPFLEAAWQANRFEVTGYWAQIERHSHRRLVDAFRGFADEPFRAENADLIWNAARLLEESGHGDEALAIWQSLIDYGRRTGDQHRLAGALGNAAIRLKDLGELDEAMEYFKEQERICLSNSDYYGLQNSLGNQGLVKARQGNFDDALTLHKAKEIICREIGHQLGIAASLGNQALILKARDPIAALALHHEEMQICDAIGDRAGFARSLRNQALIYEDIGKFNQALVLFRDSEGVCRELGNKVELAKCLMDQARLVQKHEATAMATEALLKYSESEAIFRDIGDRESLARCLHGVSRIHILLNQPNEALNCLDEAQDIFRECNNDDGFEACLLNRAIVIFGWDAQMGLEMLDEQEVRLRETGNKEFLIQCLLTQVPILLKLGRIGEAMEKSIESEALCRETGDTIRLALSLAYQTKIR